MKKICYILILFIFIQHNIKAQVNACPTNIGFENGDFTGWECFSGRINSAGEISVSNTIPVGGVHSISKNQNPQQLDFFGKFPINCPNGSNYSVKLGNESSNALAEKITYNISIPANRNEYSIIYHYAVVFQNPGHLEHQQPKFTAKIFDETAGKYIDCGSFEYVASSGLPGFSLSPLGRDVYYKPWSPVTIKLLGYAGKNIRLEFTTNDCSVGGHFGYAYIDVDENCTSPITGNVYCPNTNNLSLVAPFGFAQYRWFNANFSTVLSTTNILKISPPPPNNTVFAVEITPFPGLGCLDTLYTTVSGVLDLLNLQVKDSVIACDNKGIDITQPFVTAGSTQNLRFNYFVDEEATIPIQTPKDIKTPGKYYIKATNTAGCTEVKPVELAFKNAPILKISNPAVTCKPAFANITQNSITSGSDAGLLFSYWQNEDTSLRISRPDSITQSNTYYIKANDKNGCFAISKVNVTIEEIPNLQSSKVTFCNEADLTNPLVIGNNTNLTYNYFFDSATTQIVTNPSKIKISGKYFVKATSKNGCTVIKSSEISLLPLPNFSVSDSLEAELPITINLSDAIRVSNGLLFSYWLDSSSKTILPIPNAIKETGTYYIKGTDNNGCSISKPVYVTLNEPPLVDVVAPNIFSPNNDGINDFFSVKIKGYLGSFKCNIYDRSGQIIFSTNDPFFKWNGQTNSGKLLPIATYYWIMELNDAFREIKNTKSGSITIVK